MNQIVELQSVLSEQQIGPLYANFPLEFVLISGLPITTESPPGTIVGGFRVVAGEVSSVSLVDGTGSDGNIYFQIVPRPIDDLTTDLDFYLVINSFLFNNEYNIRVRIDDPSGPGVSESYYVEQRYNFKLYDLLYQENLTNSNLFGTLFSSLSLALSGNNSELDLGTLVGKSSFSLGSISSQESLATLSVFSNITIESKESLGNLSIVLAYNLSSLQSSENLQRLIVNYFLFSQEISWNLNLPVELSFPITWDSGLGVARWYRVEGCCIFPTSQGSGSGIPGPFYPGGCDVSNFESTDGKCIGATGRQLFIQNLLATSVADVCRQLDSYNMKWQVCKMQVYSNPAGPLVDSCNKLIDVPFSGLPECIEVALQTDAIVRITFQDSILFSYRFVGAGGISCLGTANVFSSGDVDSYFSYKGNGGLNVEGEGITSNSWDSILELEVIFNSYISYFDAITSFNQPGATLTGSTSMVRTSCGNCTQIPSILYSHLNLDKSYIISQFILKNSIEFPDYFTMYYNSNLRSWTSNYRVSGFGDLGEEVWSFVSTWSCLNKRADEESNPYWKYSILINRTLSNFNFDTKISVIFPPEELCRLINNFSLDFSFRLNTLTLYIENSFVDATDYVVLSDKIGVFKDSFWAADPWLDIRFSKSTNSPGFRTIDLSSIIP